MEPYLEDEEVSNTMSVILIPALCGVQLLNCQIIIFFKLLFVEINLQLGSLQHTTVIKLRNFKKIKAFRLKRAVSWQFSSFCLILLITGPQSLSNLKKAKKIHVNDKIRDLRQTNMTPEHYFSSCKQQGSTLKNC